MKLFTFEYPHITSFLENLILVLSVFVFQNCSLHRVFWMSGKTYLSKMADT